MDICFWDSLLNLDNSAFAWDLISSTSADTLFTIDWTSVAALLWVSSTTLWAWWWIWLTNWDASARTLVLSCSMRLSASPRTWPTTLPANCKASCLVVSTIRLASARISGSTETLSSLRMKVAFCGLFALALEPWPNPVPGGDPSVGFLGSWNGLDGKLIGDCSLEPLTNRDKVSSGVCLSDWSVPFVRPFEHFVPYLLMMMSHWWMSLGQWFYG